MQLNLMSCRGNYPQMNFKENGGECGAQKGINFDKISSINISGENMSKDIIKSINKQVITAPDIAMNEYEEKAVDFNELDEVFQKFSSSAVTLSKNPTPNYLPVKPYAKKFTRVPSKKIDVSLSAVQSAIEEKPIQSTPAQSQSSHKINFVVNKGEQPQLDAKAQPIQVSKSNFKPLQKIGQSAKNSQESPTKIVIPLLNINVNPIQAQPSVINGDITSPGKKGMVLNINQPTKSSQSKEDRNLNGLHTPGNSSSKDEANPNRSSRKLLKKIKKLLLQLNDKYQTVNDIATKSYNFSYNKNFYILLMNKKEKKIITLSKQEANNKETIYKDETDIFNELHSIKDNIDEHLLSRKRDRDSS